jgi:hypothetical protein
MSSEEEAKAWDDVTDAIIESAEILRARPMSSPPMPTQFKHNGEEEEGKDKDKDKDKIKRAKFRKQDLPDEVKEHVRVYDRYGIEKKEIIEFDPETFEGKRISPITGEVEDCFEYNGYIVAEGHGHPDEIEYTDVIEKVKEDKIKYKTLHRFDTPEQHFASGEEVPKNLRGTDRSLDSMRCVKCQSKLKFIDEIQEGGEIVKAIQCTNAACGLLWEQAKSVEK